MVGRRLDRRGVGGAGRIGSPALFLSLGWNFLEFGLRPPGGEPGEVVWSWLFCAVVFGLMGAVPLAVAVWGIREARRVGGPRPSRVTFVPGRRSLEAPLGRYAVTVAARRTSQTSLRDDGDPTSRATARAPHNAGDLTDAEFEAAKRATLDAADAR